MCSTSCVFAGPRVSYGMCRLLANQFIKISHSCPLDRVCASLQVEYAFVQWIKITFPGTIAAVLSIYSIIMCVFICAAPSHSITLLSLVELSCGGGGGNATMEIIHHTTVSNNMNWTCRTTHVSVFVSFSQWIDNTQSNGMCVYRQRLSLQSLSLLFLWSF